MHNTLRFLATLAMLLNLKHHALHGAPAKDYFLLDVAEKKGGEDQKDDAKDDILTYSYLVIPKRIPNQPLCTWVQGQGYEYVGLQDTHADQSQGCDLSEDLLAQEKNDLLVTEKAVKKYIRGYSAYLLTYDQGRFATKKLDDSDLDKPFPASYIPKEDRTLLYILAVLVLGGVVYVVFGRREDSDASLSERSKHAERTDDKSPPAKPYLQPVPEAKAHKALDD